MIQLHLFHERRHYTSKSADIPVLSDIEWTSNRLRVFEALQALNAVATAVAKSPDFREKCKWAFKTAHIDFPHIQNSNCKGRLSTRKLKSKDPKVKVRVKKSIPPKSEMISYTDSVKLKGHPPSTTVESSLRARQVPRLHAGAVGGPGARGLGGSVHQGARSKGG